MSYVNGHSSTWIAYAPKEIRPAVEESLDEMRGWIYAAAMDDQRIHSIIHPEIALFLDRMQDLDFDKKTNFLIEMIISRCLERSERMTGTFFYENSLMCLNSFNLLTGRYNELKKVHRINEIVNNRLSEKLQDLSIFSTDYLYGLCGVAKYILTQSDQKLRRRLGEVLCELRRRSKFADGFDMVSGRAGVCNLGLAHGIPGLLVVAADAIRTDAMEVASDLVSDISAFIIDNRQFGQPTIYGYYTGKTEPSRIGWCYGDLSVALALARAGIAADLVEVRAYATWLAEQIIGRSPKDAVISDASLCHGSLGAAHCFQRLFTFTGSSAAASEASRWLCYFLEGRRERRSQLLEGATLLKGISGAGLALISSLVAHGSEWDSLLLLSESPTSKLV